MLDQRSWLGALVEDLRLAFIDAAAAAHWDVPWLEEIHMVPWLQFLFKGPRRRIRVALRVKGSDRLLHTSKLAEWNVEYNRHRPPRGFSQ
jgi:hypothetical protein